MLAREFLKLRANPTEEAESLSTEFRQVIIGIGILQRDIPELILNLKEGVRDIRIEASSPPFLYHLSHLLMGKAFPIGAPAYQRIVAIRDSH